jgi:hypothetical protein
VEKSIPRRCPQWFPGTTPKSLILVSAQQFLRAGKVLLDEAGKPLFEGPDSAARAFIGGHVLAIEIAKAMNWPCASSSTFFQRVRWVLARSARASIRA